MTEARVFVAGDCGMVGSAIVRRLRARGYTRILTVPRTELDLLRQAGVEDWFQRNRPEHVYLAAARVGGIHANNTYRADFIYENLVIATNVIRAAHLAGVLRLLFLGSSCIYPRLAQQPMTEDSLLGGPLEPTNEPYALAKIAGIKLCESYNHQYGCDYRSVMPTNLYGPGDNFHPENGHVIPALLRRFHEAVKHGAPSLAVWGSGNAKREFMHVDDVASACVHVMELDRTVHAANTRPRVSHINVGTGEDCSIRELAETIARVTGFTGRIEFDTSKPDGPPRKLLDVSRLTALGWRASIPLERGLRETYAWFSENSLAGEYRA